MNAQPKLKRSKHAGPILHTINIKTRCIIRIHNRPVACRCKHKHVAHVVVRKRQLRTPIGLAKRKTIMAVFVNFVFVAIQHIGTSIKARRAAAARRLKRINIPKQTRGIERIVVIDKRKVIAMCMSCCLITVTSNTGITLQFYNNKAAIKRRYTLKRLHKFDLIRRCNSTDNFEPCITLRAQAIY